MGITLKQCKDINLISMRKPISICIKYRTTFVNILSPVFYVLFEIFRVLSIPVYKEPGTLISMYKYNICFSADA